MHPKAVFVFCLPDCAFLGQGCHGSSWRLAQGTARFVVGGEWSYLSTWFWGTMRVFWRRMGCPRVFLSVFAETLWLWSLATLFVINSIVVRGGGSGHIDTELGNVKWFGTTSYWPLGGVVQSDWKACALWIHNFCNTTQILSCHIQIMVWCQRKYYATLLTRFKLLPHICARHIVV